jgi:hypothetical protein
MRNCGVVLTDGARHAGDSAIVSVGAFKLNDGVSSDDYPLGTMITGNHFHEIGVTGKQTSALFSVRAYMGRLLYL